PVGHDHSNAISRENLLGIAADHAIGGRYSRGPSASFVGAHADQVSVRNSDVSPGVVIEKLEASRGGSVVPPIGARGTIDPVYSVRRTEGGQCAPMNIGSGSVIEAVVVALRVEDILYEVDTIEGMHRDARSTPPKVGDDHVVIHDNP